MPPKLVNISENLIIVEAYIKQASQKEADLIVFPEFFTTGFAFCEEMWDAIIDSAYVEKRMEYFLIMLWSIVLLKSSPTNIFLQFAMRMLA